MSMRLEERLAEVRDYACDCTDGVLDDTHYRMFKWMEDATAEIAALKEELVEVYLKEDE